MILIEELERLWKTERAAKTAYEAFKQWQYSIHMGDATKRIEQTDEYTVTYAEMLLMREALANLEISLGMCLDKAKASEREWVFVEKSSVRRMLDAMRQAPWPRDVDHPAYTDWYERYWDRVTSDLEAMLRGETRDHR